MSRPSGECELSAAVLVFNGIDTIDRCLESLKFCDEVVVVDAHSTDGTWEHLQKCDVHAVQHKQESFAAQRGHARDICRGKWLLTMDIDEYVTDELAQTIREKISQPDAPDGFYLRRRHPYPKGLKGQHWTSHPRLIKRDKCKWVDTESPHAPLDKKGIKLKHLRKGHLEHEPLSDVPTALRKSINRNLILAIQSRNQGRRPGSLRLMISTTARFLKAYFRYGAWRYGRDGYVWARLAAFEAFCKYSFQLADLEGAPQQAVDGGPGSFPKDEKPEKPGTG
jgi:glycosyltransferase involved in cell wall biosynthesis